LEATVDENRTPQRGDVRKKDEGIPVTRKTVESMKARAEEAEESADEDEEDGLIAQLIDDLFGEGDAPKPKKKPMNKVVEIEDDEDDDEEDEVPAPKPDKKSMTKKQDHKQTPRTASVYQNSKYKPRTAAIYGPPEKALEQVKRILKLIDELPDHSWNKGGSF
jgi:hypothetical protein